MSTAQIEWAKVSIWQEYIQAKKGCQSLVNNGYFFGD
jgi:hypothetical protein